ncbi:MAG: sterol desaturase family protein [Polyangiaceae bacterium]|nr:sterol desaturase family protein [Polyangiaceae bacterium]
MDARYIVVAIPFFFLLIGAELVAGRRRRESLYRFHDSITSLSCGVGMQLLLVLRVGAEAGIYAVLYERFRIATISPSSALAWIALLFGVDLGYYVYHWANHRVGFLWAMHIVHHQSEEYNLSTALRQSWFTSLVSWVFYVPLAVIGFPPAMLLAMRTLNTLYQFWIHTRAVGRLGFLEAFLNTPSHHRVHHGIDPQYIDKNYAGIFILWDRLFGTFRREEEEPVYGTVEPLSSWNPAWANVEHYVALARRARQTRRLRDKLLVWVMPPEWRPADLGGPVAVPEVSRASQTKYLSSTPRGMNVYVVVGFTITAVAVSALLSFQTKLDLPARAGAVVILLAGLSVWGGLFEARRWAVPLEWGRLAAAVALAAWLARGTASFAPVVAAAAAAALVLSLWAARYRHPRPPIAAHAGLTSGGAPIV